MPTLARNAVHCEKRKKGREMRKKWRKITSYTLFVFCSHFRVFQDKCIAGVNVRPHYAAWQKLFSICRKINHVHIKKEFFANYISVYKNCEMRNMYAPYATPKIMSLQLVAWWHIAAWQIFDETDILLIKFSCCVSFCNMLRHAETMPHCHLLCFRHFVAFCHVA